MLISDITQRLNATSLRDEAASTGSTSTEQHSSNVKIVKSLNVDTCQCAVAACSDDNGTDSSTLSPSPLIRGSGSRLSLPFNSVTCSNRVGNTFQTTDTERQSPHFTVGNSDIEVEELPIKRRHLSWAAADFRLYTVGGAPFTRRSETSRPTGNLESDVELVKPVPIRPVLASGGSKVDCRDDSGLVCNSSSSKQTSFSPSIPRPSSASSGIFDLDTSSECSKRDCDQLDRSVSNGWSSSADERRRSDEDSKNRRNAASVAAAAMIATDLPQPKTHRSFVRHCRGGAHSKLSASNGFFSLAQCGGSCHDDNCDLSPSYHCDHGAGPLPLNIMLAVPPSTSPSSNKSSMNWWRSAPDLVGSGNGPGRCPLGVENDADCCRRHQRKRNLSGRLQARPSIDLFKNQVADDDSSCCGESLVSSGASEGNDNNRCCKAELNVSSRKSKEQPSLSTRYNKIDRGKGLEAEDAGETDSDETNSLAASSRSAAGTFSMGSGSSTEPTHVTRRSLSYPWLQSHDILGDDERRSKNYDHSSTIYKSVGMISGNRRAALIEDGLRTIVGSPADTIAAVVSLPVRSNNDSLTAAASPTTNNNLLNWVVYDSSLDSSVAVSNFVDNSDKSVTKLADDEGKIGQQAEVFSEAPSSNPDSDISTRMSNCETTTPLDTQLFDTPPQLNDCPVLFLARYNFQNELDIDLIEQN